MLGPSKVIRLVMLLALATASSACLGSTPNKSAATATKATTATLPSVALPTDGVVPLGTASPTAGPAALLTNTPMPSPTSSGITYTVKEGDTLGAIAATYGTTVEAIVKANNLADPNVLSIGQVLIIPSPEAGPTSAAGTQTPAP
jgi:LysM repeat protein